MKRLCQHCSEPATTAGLCGTHYSYAYRWNQRGVAKARKHADKLRVRGAIIDNLAPTATPNNVVELSDHPRFAPKRIAARSAGKRRRAAG